MTKPAFLKIAGFISLFYAVVLLGFSLPAYAQFPGAVQGVQVSPALINLNAEPGGSYVLKVKVTNVSTKDLEYKVSTKDFRARDESGSAEVLEDSKLDPSISVRTWISSISSFRLDSTDGREVVFNIQVPANAEPGGHYGVLHFNGSEPEVSGTGVGQVANAGVLLLVKVAGDVQEKANIASFTTSQNGSDSNFFESAPVDFSTRVQNTGNIHIIPYGSVVVTNIFGATVAELTVNDKKGNVLPDSIRRFDNTYSDYMLGPYTATVTLGYGTHGQAVYATTTFWVIPWKLIGVILLVLALILFILRRLQKVYNRRVIRKYQNKHNHHDDSKKSKKSKKGRS